MRGEMDGHRKLTAIASSLIALAVLALSPRPKPELCSVVRILDGNRIMVNYQGKKEIIRLLRINTPQRNRYGSRQATKAMAGLIEGRSIRLEFESPRRLRRDQDGQILAYVWLDELNVNVEMVRLGWSLFWAKYGQGKYAEEFQQAEQEARKAGRGLWNESSRAKSRLR